ncbi:hypothetical protein Tco_0270926 [Tanacetum coccineum]
MLLPQKRTFPTPTLTQKLFSNMKRGSKGCSGVDIPLFPTMLTTPESSPSRINLHLLSPHTHPSKTHKNHNLHHSSTQTTPFLRRLLLMPHGNTSLKCSSLGRGVGSLSLNELTNLCTSLSKKVKSLESELKQTKQTYNAALTKVIKRVKKLEQTIKTRQARRRAKVVISDDEEAEGRFNDTQISDQPEEQLGVFSVATTLADATRRRRISTADISTASELDSTAGVKAKDKGNIIMHESEPPKKIKKRVQVQMSVDEELAKKLDEREEVAAKVDEAHDIDWSDPDVLRYHTLQNRPFSVAEVRKNMYLYLKNQGGYKMSHFKGMSYEDIRPIFERVWDQNHAFIPMGSEIKKEVMKKSRFDLQQESSKPVKEEIV